MTKRRRRRKERDGGNPTVKHRRRIRLSKIFRNAKIIRTQAAAHLPR